MSRGVIVDSRPGLEHDRHSVLQAASANLGTLQVLQNADGAILLVSHAAQALDDLRVLFVGSVGKVQPGHVHAEAHEVAQDRFRVACRADGADNLCPAICPTNVRCDGRRVNGRTGDFPSRLSFFQVCPDQNLCRSNYCIWRDTLVADTMRTRRRCPRHKRSRLASGVLPVPWDQRSRCQASLYGAYLLFGLEG